MARYEKGMVIRMKECQITLDGLGIETAFVYDFTSHGDLFPINYVSIAAKEEKKSLIHGKEEQGNRENALEECSIKKEALYLLTKEQIEYLTPSMVTDCLVLCLDENQTVADSYLVLGKTVYCYTQNTEGVFHKIKEASVVLLVNIEGMTNSLEQELLDSKNGINPSDYLNGLAKTVVDSFLKGDVVRYKFGVNYLSTTDLQAFIAKRMDPFSVYLKMQSKEYATVEEDRFLLEGQLVHFNSDKKYELKVTYGDGRNENWQEKKDILLEECFSVTVPLKIGANYIDCVMMENGIELTDSKTTHIVFYKEKSNHPKEVIMWAEQYVNANTTNSVEKIETLIETAKEAGITAFSLDVKGCEGYTAYKKATLSNAGYMTETKNPKKAITMEIDFLEEFVKASHAKGLKVYASFNFFVEGNIASNDFAIDLPHTHPEWAEVLYVPEDHGELKSVLETNRNCMLCYVNPANPEVQDFELLRVKELLDHYEVDGVVMDRTRYDNQYADFSEVTRLQFEEYLKAKGLELKNWPQDIYSFDVEQKMVFGPLYLTWLTFRSSIIKGFAKRLRGLVDEYAKEQDRPIALAAYVGSWFDLYYQNGVNWGSQDFSYNERLNFPVSKLYTEEYSKTSYVEYIDFLMIGCYYETAEMIEKYTTIGNIVTNHQVPMMASMSLPHLATEEALKIGTKACIDFSDGTMIFDLCYTDWSTLSGALKEALNQ